jgi:Tol biopolymer transport system component/DNA-binding winged helix-turn-helix (wHTH) protein
MSLPANHFYQFREFTLDTDQGVLLREGKPVALAPKVFDTLLILLENAGRLVTKEELMTRLWPDTFVEEDNLTYNIKQLRKSFGDDARNPAYIETIARRGYRFIAEVKPVEAKAEKGEKFEVIDNPASQPPGDVLAPARFPRRVDETENQSSAGAVALADWRRKASANKAEEATATVSPEPSSRKIANLELVRATRPRRRTAFYILTGLIGVALLAGLGYTIYRFTSASKTPAPSSSKFMRLTDNGKTMAAAVSPDGKFIAYVIEDEKEQSLWLKNIPTGSDTQILPPVEKTVIANVTFSPDGNYIFYGSLAGAKAAIFQLPVLGGRPKKILADYAGPISFSPDGKQLTFIRFSSTNEETASIVIVNTDGTDERILASSKRPNIFLRSAVWSPDGKQIACVALNSVEDQAVVVLRVGDGAISPVPSPSWSYIGQVAWRPDGNSFLVIVTDDSNENQIWSLSYPGGEARRVTEDLNVYRSISLPADASSIVAVRIEQEALLWVMPGDDASRAKPLTSGFEKFDGVYALYWTKNNKIIYENVPSGHPSIWTINPDGHGLKQISAESAEPAVSPDESYLVYQTKNAEGSGLFRVSVADGQKKRLTTGPDRDATFSPDGRWVVFLRYADDIALWKVSIDGGEAVKLTNVVSAYPQVPTVSPDGKLIAFHLLRISRAQFPEIALIPFDGGEIIKTFDTPKMRWNFYARNALQWTPDGQAIFFVAERDNVSNIWRQPIDGSPAVQVTNFESGLIFNFAYSPDGKRLVLSRGTYSCDVVLINNRE